MCIHRDGKGDDMKFGAFDHLDRGGGNLADQHEDRLQVIEPEIGWTSRLLSSPNTSNGEHLSARGRRRHRPSYTQSKDTLQEFAIRQTIMKSRLGKFLTLGDLRIGIRFEKVWDPFRG